MASDESFVEYVKNQIQIAGTVTSKKMFGEYAIYVNGKVVALVCENQVYVKQTETGRRFIDEVVEAPAYPGAKNSFLLGDEIDDSEWFSELIQRTERELPFPKKKRKR